MHMCHAAPHTHDTPSSSTESMSRRSRANKKALDGARKKTATKAKTTKEGQQSEG